MASFSPKYLNLMKASDIPRSTELLLDCSELDVLRDDTLVVLTTHGEVIDFVNVLQRNLAEHGAVAKRHQRMRHTCGILRCLLTNSNSRYLGLHWYVEWRCQRC
jgi:hypothetical protein